LSEQTFKSRSAFFVPTEQAQYRLIRGLFERPTVFSDSIFYDISAWILPDAFGLRWTPVKGNKPSVSKTLSRVSHNPPSVISGGPDYAYIVPALGYEIPSVLVKLQKSVRYKQTVRQRNFLWESD